MIAVTYFAGVTSKAGPEIFHIVGRNLFAVEVGDFLRGTLFDGNLLAGWSRHVDGGPRRGHVKRNAMLLGEDGNSVGSNFIGKIPVGGNAICAHNKQL